MASHFRILVFSIQVFWLRIRAISDNFHVLRSLGATPAMALYLVFVWPSYLSVDGSILSIGVAPELSSNGQAHTKWFWQTVNRAPFRIWDVQRPTTPIVQWFHIRYVDLIHGFIGINEVAESLLWGISGKGYAAGGSAAFAAGLIQKSACSALTKSSGNMLIRPSRDTRGSSASVYKIGS